MDGDADTFRHIDDGSARIENEANGLVLVLLGEVSACRHAIPSAAISGSLRPVVYKIGNGPLWNTVSLDAALGRLRDEGYPVRDEDLVRLSAYMRRHLNVHGHYRALRDPDSSDDDEDR